MTLSKEETVERDAVHKALMSLIRQDPKGSLISLQFFFSVFEGADYS